MGLTDWLLFLDARRASGSTIPNLGTGSGLDATIGGNVKVVNGPAVRLPGVAGSYLSVPDEAALDITGDICLMARIAPDTWTPAASQAIIGKWDGGSQKSYRLYLHTSGNLYFTYSADGSVGTNMISTAAPAGSPGEPLWVAVTVDVNDGGGNRVAKFWTGGSSVAPSWAQLGSTVTTAGAVTIFSGTSPASVGAISAGTDLLFAGAISDAHIYNGIGANTAPAQGTKVFEFDAASDIATADVDATSFTASTGQTVTVNRAATGGPVLVVPDGVSMAVNPDSTNTANKITTPHTSALNIGAGEHAVLAWVGVLGNNPGGFVRPVLLGADAGESFKMFRASSGNTIAAQFRTGGTFPSTGYVAGSLTALDAYFAVVDRDADVIRFFRVEADGTTTTATTVDISAVGALTFTAGFTALLSCPSGVEFVAYDKPATPPSAAELTTLGTSLLADYTAPATSGTATSTPRVNTTNTSPRTATTDTTPRTNTIEAPA